MSNLKFWAAHLFISSLFLAGLFSNAEIETCSSAMDSCSPSNVKFIIGWLYVLGIPVLRQIYIKMGGWSGIKNFLK